MDLPLVSILTPSYNQAEWLEACLRSVASQSYERVEHIVMDGASTDGSLDIIQRAAARGSSLRWESASDRGQSDALNKAFSASAGEIVGWINSDDALFGISTIQDVVDVFLRRPDVDVVYGHVAGTGADGRVQMYIWVPPFAHKMLKLRTSLPQPGVFARRAALESVALPGGRIVDEDLHFKMDHHLWFRLHSTSRFARINQVVAIDRHHAERKSVTLVDVLSDNDERLHRDFGFWTSPPARLLKLLVGALFRAAAVPLALRTPLTDLAFDGPQGPRWRVALNQLTRPTRR